MKKKSRYFLLFALSLSVASCGQLTDKDTHQVYDSIYVMQADGSAVTRVSPDAPYHYQNPNWSPDSSKIAYGSASLGDIFITTLSDQTVENLTNTHSRIESQPQWAPDGSAIAYFVQTGMTKAVYVHPLAGTGTFVLGDASAFVWSPDSTHLAIRSKDKLYVVTKEGNIQGTPTPAAADPVIWLSNTVLRYTSPSGLDMLWSLSGTPVPLLEPQTTGWALPRAQLASGDNGYYRIDTEGRIKKVLSHATYAVDSSDSNTLLSVYQYALYRHQPDGSHTTLIFTASSGMMGLPQLSETSVVWVSGTEIYVADIASGVATPIGKGIGPHWSPDGNKISYIGFRRVSQ